MEPEFRCYTDPRPKLPGGRLVTVTSMPRELTSVRYAFRLAARATENWIDEAKWHDADGFRAEGSFLRFQVPAVVANGLERGERYAIAVCDADARGMVLGEISWPENPERWDDGVERYSEPGPDLESQPAAAAPEEEAPAGGGGLRWAAILVVVLGLAGAGGWWYLQSRDVKAPGEVAAPPPPRVNQPPTAGIIDIRLPPGEERVIDIREFARDPDGGEPSLSEVLPAQFGTAERIDDFRFRYRASERTSLTDDFFSYRIEDTEGASTTGWVSVTIVAEDAVVPPPVVEAAPAPVPAPRPGPAQPNPEVDRLREEIARALENGEYDRVKVLCTTAILLDAQLARFCGIAFDPSRTMFDAKKDPEFALQSYQLAIDFGDQGATEYLEQLRTWMRSKP